MDEWTAYLNGLTLAIMVLERLNLVWLTAGGEDKEHGCDSVLISVILAMQIVFCESAPFARLSNYRHLEIFTDF